MLRKAFSYPMPEGAEPSEAPPEELEVTLEEELADVTLEEYSDESDFK